MAQTITVKVKLLPTAKQASILNAMRKEYISTINALISEMACGITKTIRLISTISICL